MRAGPNPTGLWPYENGKFGAQTDTHTHPHTLPCEPEGRDWVDVSTRNTQEGRQVLKPRKGHGTDPSLVSSEGAWPQLHLGLGFLAHEMVNVVLSSPVSGTVLYKP